MNNWMLVGAGDPSIGLNICREEWKYSSVSRWIRESPIPSDRHLTDWDIPFTQYDSPLPAFRTNIRITLQLWDVNSQNNPFITHLG